MQAFHDAKRAVGCAGCQVKVLILAAEVVATEAKVRDLVINADLLVPLEQQRFLWVFAVKGLPAFLAEVRYIVLTEKLGMLLFAVLAGFHALKQD